MIYKAEWKKEGNGFKLTVRVQGASCGYRQLAVFIEKIAATPENICDSINKLIKQLND